MGIYRTILGQSERTPWGPTGQREKPWDVEKILILDPSEKTPC
jgi:hypothetical protein